MGARGAQTVIAGAGLAGLSCARRLGPGFRILERDDRPGGYCRTEMRGGFTVDHTGHYLHFKDEGMRAEVADLLGPNLHGVPRDSWVYLDRRYTPYPFQANTFGHDPAVVRECVLGLFAAAESGEPARPGESYAAWIRRTQGEGFLRRFMRPFNEKQFRRPLEELLPLQGGRFLPRPNLEQIVRGALKPARAAIGYNAAMWHPRHGGIEVLPRALAAALPAAPEAGRPLLRLKWRERVAEFGGVGPVPYGVLVSTLALPDLLETLDPLPPELARARKALAWIGVLCAHVLTRRPRETRKHWVYVPDPRYSFYRFGFPANINRADAPRGCGVISAELSYPAGRRPDPARALARVKHELRALGQLGPERDVVDAFVVDFPVGYVVFDRAYPRARAAALRWLAARNILSIGRYGGWVYGGMEDALVEGRETGRLIAAYGERAGSRFPGAAA